jgi:hypothetical protein
MKQIPSRSSLVRTLIAACLCVVFLLVPSAYSKPADSARISGTEGRYRQGDKLYVFAHSGLVLRGQPDPQGAKIMTIPSASVVEVIDPAPFRLAHSVKEDCGLLIPGYWVEVSFEGKTGYLFDGYLLKHLPRSRAEYAGFWAGDAKLVFHTNSEPPREPTLWKYTKEIWENGVHTTYERGEAGGGTTTYLPKGMYAFVEVYLLAISGDLSPSLPRKWKCDCGGKKAYVECTSPDGLETLIIEVDGSGNTVVSELFAD